MAACSKLTFSGIFTNLEAANMEKSACASDKKKKNKKYNNNNGYTLFLYC